jgi:hypothetical protein
MSAGCVFKTYLKQIAAERTTIQFCNGGAGFMTLHADIAKTFALTAEHIGDYFNGMDFAEFREQGCYTGFCSVARQVANKYSFQKVSLVVWRRLYAFAICSLAYKDDAALVDLLGKERLITYASIAWSLEWQLLASIISIATSLEGLASRRSQTLQPYAD